MPALLRLLTDFSEDEIRGTKIGKGLRDGDPRRKHDILSQEDLPSHLRNEGNQEYACKQTNSSLHTEIFCLRECLVGHGLRRSIMASKVKRGKGCIRWPSHASCVIGRASVSRNAWGRSKVESIEKA